MVRLKRPDPHRREHELEKAREKRRSKDLSLHIEVAEAILSNLDCPRALTVVIMIRHGMWDEIANLKLDPKGFNDSMSFFRAYQATKLLSKAKWIPTSIDKLAVAKTKFQEAETLCAETNQRWALYRQTFKDRPKNLFPELPDYERIFSSARRKIGKVLGAELYKWTEYCDFGPGSDGSTEAGMTSAYNKLSNPGCVTLGAYPLLDTFCSLTSLGYLFVGNPETKRLQVELVRGNTVTFVSKNAKTDRPIAVEPRWNMFMQKGFGRFLRMRLKLFGVNLDFQGLNQALAIYGSRTGKYATLDLASASDTVSKEVVQALLPEPWVHILGSLRSPAYLLDGEWRSYNKWSSMGNGYTFELESLLFWALASSVNEDVAVYGDDLIVPSESYDAIVRVLQVCGFRVNTDKSFHDGQFRESCGQDAFNGDSVTPIYWKEALDDLGTLSLVNQITSLASFLAPEGFRLSGFKEVWKRLVYQLPKRLQTRGPTSLTTVVHDSSTKWNAVRKWGWDGLHLHVWVPVPRRYEYLNFEAAIISQNFQPFSDGYTVRDRWFWKKKTIFIPCGYKDIGPWV